MHAGGVLADAALQRQTAAGMRTVRAPKAGSLDALKTAMATQPTSMHIMFSSLAALLPSAGQANYAAANAELDSAASMCAVFPSYGALHIRSSTCLRSLQMSCHRPLATQIPG